MRFIWFALGVGGLLAPAGAIGQEVGATTHLSLTQAGATLEEGFILSWATTAGLLYNVERSIDLVTWEVVARDVTAAPPVNTVVDVPPLAGGQAFYRVVLLELPDTAEFAVIPAGSFQMGDAFAEGFSTELPVHSVHVSEFYMGKYEVTKALWDEVRAWGFANGYTDLEVGGGKASNHPVHTVSWYDVVKWCNARSEKEGLTPCYTVGEAVYRTGSSNSVACDWNAGGYRLPTEAEWEKAARGGLSGARFPWGNTISHSQANYYASGTAYGNQSGNAGYHPSYNDGVDPYTAPVGSFAANGYGLHDVAGNVWEWCWDWYSTSGYYASSPGSDPRGAASDISRVFRGGHWYGYDGADFCRLASRHGHLPGIIFFNLGFRLARSSVP